MNAVERVMAVRGMSESEAKGAEIAAAQWPESDQLPGQIERVKQAIEAAQEVNDLTRDGVLSHSIGMALASLATAMRHLREKERLLKVKSQSRSGRT